MDSSTSQHYYAIVSGRGKLTSQTRGALAMSTTPYIKRSAQDSLVKLLLEWQRLSGGFIQDS